MEIDIDQSDVKVSSVKDDLKTNLLKNIISIKTMDSVKLPEHRGFSEESIQYACEKNSINYKIIPKESENVTNTEKKMVEFEMPNYFAKTKKSNKEKDAHLNNKLNNSSNNSNTCNLSNNNNEIEDVKISIKNKEDVTEDSFLNYLEDDDKYIKKDKKSKNNKKSKNKKDAAKTNEM